VRPTGASESLAAGPLKLPRVIHPFSIMGRFFVIPPGSSTGQGDSFPSFLSISKKLCYHNHNHKKFCSSAHLLERSIPMWKIIHIFDGDYGCEEQTGTPTVTVTLTNEAGQQRIIRVPDSLLTKNGLDVGSVWPAHKYP
jgi:hypothetical protein